ncbi:MAG: hypothetical protein WCO09_03505 [bacterium]
MTTKKIEKKGGSALGVLGMIGGLAAATAVGAYFVHNSKDAKKKIKNAKGWVLKAKGDVLDKLEDMKDVTEDKYKTTVDSVLSKYGKIKKIEAPELEKLAVELKSHWKTIVKELSAGTKSVKKVVKGGTAVTKKVVKGK